MPPIARPAPGQNINIVELNGKTPEIRTSCPGAFADCGGHADEPKLAIQSFNKQVVAEPLASVNVRLTNSSGSPGPLDRSRLEIWLIVTVQAFGAFEQFCP
jgi:hypothetical protein